MKKIVFYLKEFHIGGAQLLIVRWAAKFVELGYDTTIIGVFEDNKLYNDILKLHINTVTIEPWDNDAVARKIVKEECDNAFVVTLNWIDYCRIVYLRKSARNTIFYVCHYNDLVAAAKNRFKLLEYFRKFIVKSAIERLIKRHVIIAMDEESTQKTQDYYQYSNETIKEFKIVRLAIDTNNTNYSIDIKFQDNYFRILTIARADFPFKGYMLGLVSLLNNNMLPTNVLLEIVSTGKDQGLLEQLIEKCEENVKKKIRLYGKMEYDSLGDLYKKSMVFVGMGTALLDAAKFGTIAVPVEAYTSEVRTSGFFHEDYRKVVAEGGSTENFLKCINWIQTLNKEEYLKYFSKNMELIEKNYSTRSVVEELIKIMEKCEDNHDCMLNCKISYFTSKMIDKLVSKSKRRKVENV